MLASASAAQAAERLDFRVLRDGVDIGHHRVTVEQDGDRIEAEVEVELKVSLLGLMTVYRYVHQNREVWRHGKLQRIDSQTEDNGDRLSVRGWRDGDVLRVQAAGGEQVLPAGTLSTNWWNAALVHSHELLNSQTGELMQVRIAPVGQETIVAAGHPVTATRYAIAGDLEMEIWYDAGGGWVKSRFQAQDGSTIELLLK